MYFPNFVVWWSSPLVSSDQWRMVDEIGEKLYYCWLGFVLVVKSSVKLNCVNCYLMVFGLHLQDSSHWDWC